MSYSETQGASEHSSSMDFWSDIYMPDGRTLQHYDNIVLPSLLHDRGPAYIRATNEYTQFKCLERRGIVEFPEVAAVEPNGSASTYRAAVYVDERIGRETVFNLSWGWLMDYGLRFSPRYHTEIISADEFGAILAIGIEETGIGAILEQMRAEDAARVQQAPSLDINAIMRNMRDQLRGSH